MLRLNKYKTLLVIIFISLVLNACTLFGPKITKAKYDRLQTGMTLTEVQNIMGETGENSAEMSFSIPNVNASPNDANLAAEFKPSVYQWKNPDGSSMTAIFVNNKLVGKSQVNLK